MPCSGEVETRGCCRPVVVAPLLIFVVDALQTILGAWNKSTPDMDSNLAGWGWDTREQFWQYLDLIRTPQINPLDEGRRARCSVITQILIAQTIRFLWLACKNSSLPGFYSIVQFA